jgi:hypothetical protein
MKKLIESWNKHLKENITQDQREQSVDKIAYWIGNKKQAQKIVDTVPTFNDAYIIKIKGSGQGGIAYELSNGNILKLYHSAYVHGGTIEAQDREYENIMRKAFGGTSFRGEISVYGHGIIEGEPKSIMSMGFKPIGWAEINKITTLMDYYRLLKLPPHIIEDKKDAFDKMVEDIHECFHNALVDKDEDYYDAMEIFDQSYHNNKYIYREALTDNEIIAFKTGLFKFYKQHEYNPTLDVHFQNCGLMWPSDLTSFVVFDY